MAESKKPEIWVPESGYYVAIEGTDGSGSSTTIQRYLLPGLERRGLEYGIKKRVHGTGFGTDIVATREPGGTKIGEEKYRYELLHDKTKQLSAGEQFSRFNSNRKELSKQVVVPALAVGKFVVSERSYGSSYAYQGHAGGVNKDYIIQTTKTSINPRMFEPDARVLINVTPVEARRRLKNRGTEDDNIESSGPEYFDAVYEGYLELAEKFDFEVIDGDDKHRELVGKEVLHAVIGQIGKENFQDYVEERKSLRE